MYGLGTDILMISRIQSWINDDAMLNYVFTQNERTSAQKKRYPHKYLAKILAAKEAFMKAIGTGWSNGIGWKDIEIIEENRSISIKLYNKANDLCNNKKVFVSVSCTDSLAVAVVVVSDTEQDGHDAICQL
ncbi:MAG: holo-ACP synthase [Nitrospirota bacterium]